MSATRAEGFRARLVRYIQQQANPPDKFSHQARLYELCRTLSEGHDCDDDVIFAAAWVHDLGVFVGHRPEEVGELAKWDHLEYVMSKGHGALADAGFPQGKVAAVMEAVRTHMPQCEPQTIEGVILRDADILEQLGAVGILRTVSKVGRDTRFRLFSDALRVLRKNRQELPGSLKLEKARKMAQPRLAVLASFLEHAEAEAVSQPW